MKTCVICNQERTPASFSTLARWRSAVVRKSELESVACTGCYWMQLVTHHPRLGIDENGRCVDTYVRRDKPRWEYVTEVRARVPRLEKDKDIIEAYGFLGPISEQIRPFLDWVETAQKEFEMMDQEMGDGRLPAQALPELKEPQGTILTGGIVLCHKNTERTAVVMSVCSAVSAAVEAASAIAESEPHNLQATVVRLYNQMRRTVVIDAIKYELVKRNNQLVACQTPGVRPLIQTHSRENAMEHARARELKLLDVLGVER